MKIALFVPSWPAGNGANGIVTYAAYLVPALRRIGHQVYVLTPRVMNNVESGDAAYTVDLQQYLPKTTIWDRFAYRLRPANARFNKMSASIAAAVRKLIVEEEIDVLEMEESFGWSFGISRLRLLPVVVRLHGPWFVNGIGAPNTEHAVNRDREQREGRGIGQAQIVTSSSANVIRAVKQHYGFKLAASRVIPNPMPVVLERDKWNMDACCEDSLLFVGRIDKRKGADMVIRAFVDLATRRPRLKLTIVGPDTGINDSGGVLSFDHFVMANVPEPFRARIKYLGSVANSEVMSLRVEHFATIVASRFEVAPYSILEAMSVGCPLIAAAVGGIPEMITNHRNGILVQSEDVPALVDACDTLLEDKATAARLGHQAWLDCQNVYSPDKIAEDSVAAYIGAIEKFKLQAE